MSDIRFNRWLHQSGTGGVSQDSSGNIGIGTTVPTMALDVRGDINVGDTININNASGIISATTVTATTVTATTGTFSGNMSVTGNVSIAGTLTYEDVSNIDAVGIITAQSDIVVGGGLTVTGISTFNNDVKLLDSDKLKFGIGEDLQIYHDPGTGDSFISESGTGNLKLTTSSFRLRNAADTEHIIWANQDAEVRLYHDNSKKFETTSSGAIVTGILTASTFSGNLTGNVTGDLTGNLAGISSIATISSSISDTAVDVFVYDTRKDSDGGAWRKRTQHTSWYNETLGTATRGTRKEFPTVAVIVYGSGFINIYDGDDPDLPMWMTFDSNNFQNFVTNIPATLSMLNGVLVWGCKHTNSGFAQNNLVICNFISEKTERISYAGHTYSGTDRTGIVNRNVWNNSSTWIGNRPLDLVNYYINDVAMTVLPNAPIDSATGLPVPTIAVATDGGVSVIKDDGTVVDITNGIGNTKVAFIDGGNRLMVSRNTQTTVETGEIPTADIAASSWRHTYYNDASVVATLGSDNAKKLAENTSVGGNSGLSLINENLSSGTNGLVAYATTSYNTGYMHGDIKGAFLSDTDTTNATELVTNGYFDSDLNGWTTPIGTSTLDANRLLITAPNGGASWGYAHTSITTEINKTYKISLHYDKGTADGRLVVKNDSTNSSAGLLEGTGVNAGGWRDLGSSDDGKTIFATFTATAPTTFILVFSKSTSGGTSAYDQISVTLEKDRSINGKGLSVFGTVTKSVVATGAELVAYSGFSLNDYLKQPHNSDMQTGTGEFSVSAWFKTTSTSDQYEGLVYYNRNESLGTGFQIMLEPISSGKGIYFYIYGASTQVSTTPVDGLNDGEWHQVVATYSNGFIQLFIDGTLRETSNNPNAGSINDSEAQLHIGKHSTDTTSERQWRGSIALVRHSASIPSAEQIKKMYEDEKVLFRPNAKATLHGSSDAVTALAYDDTTNILHVGTTAGRSEFQGLLRINNTTDPVTAAISASNDLVAEK